MTNEGAIEVLLGIKHFFKMGTVEDKAFDMAIEALGKDTNVPSKEETIPVDYLTSRINDFRQRESYAGRFAADCLQAVINEYNKEKNT